MSQSSIKILTNFLRWGLFLLPIYALIIAGNFYGNILLPGAGDMFFPFITGKNFFFRIVVEILFALWAFTAVFDKKLRPSLSPVFYALGVTLVALTLATFLGENTSRSLWSNYERMEGLITHFHLFAYFLLLISVFKSKLDWVKFLWANIVVSFFVSSYAYLQLFGSIPTYQSGNRLDATLGNSTYLAIYIIFHIFILLYLFLSSDGTAKRPTGNSWAKYIAAFLFLFEIPIVFFTATRGAILGLLGGFLLFAILLGAFGGGGKTRKISWGIVGAVILIVGGFLLIKDSTFVGNNYVLERFATLSLSEQTTTSRLTIWSMSFEGFKEHAIIGWGPENYILLFNKYFRPEMWNQEPWFDRAHNVFFDWLVAAGIVGLLAYLSIFVTALYMLWRRRDDWVLPVVFVSLFGAYFFHNIFVFDNITSYFLFFTVLGFIHFSYLKNENINVPSALPGNSNSFAFVLPAIVIILLPFVLYFVNVKPIMANRSLIGALREMNSNYNDTDKVLAEFNNVLKLNTFGTGESREQLALYANNISSRTEIPEAKRREVLELAISELEKQVAGSPRDARGYMFLAPLYVAAGNPQKAVETAEGALEAAPNKQQILFVATDVYLNTGNIDKALESVKKAYELDKTFGEAAVNYAIIAVATGNVKVGEDVLEESFGTRIIADVRLANAYGRAGNLSRIRDVWRLLADRNPGDSQYRVSLAASLLNLGDREGAIKELEEAIVLNPGFKEQGEYFINEIKAGRNP